MIDTLKSIELKANLINRWKNIHLTNSEYTEESVKRNIMGILGTSENWKEELSGFLIKINLPFMNPDIESKVEINNRETKVYLDLRGIDLSGERFTARRFNEFAYARNSDRHSSSIGDMSGLHLEYSNLTGVLFEGIDISNSFFDSANMEGGIFRHSKCVNSSFIGVIGSKMIFEGSDMTKSCFVFSDLSRSQILSSQIEDCDFTGSILFRAKIVSSSCDVLTRFVCHKTMTAKFKDSAIVRLRDKEVFLDENGKVLYSTMKINDSDKLKWAPTSEYSVISDERNKLNSEEDWSEIKEIYRQIKLMFRSYGFYSESDMYFFLELKAKRKSHASVVYRSFMKALEMLTGYGIKIERMVMLALASVLMFSIVYFAWNDHLVLSDPAAGATLSERFASSLYFSIVTFTTVGYGDIHPVGFMRFVANLEAFSGLLVMGLFVVSITRKFIGD